VRQESPRVVIGMDPHKRSVTIEVMDGDEHVLGGGRFATDAAGYRSLLDRVRAWPNRVWAIEGCNGIGRHISHRLIADGEQVLDVPPKISARARVFATGQGRKTDATDAHSVALVGTRMAGLRPVVADEQLEVLRLLVDRRRSLGEEHTRKVSQLHALLLELLPGGAKVFLSAAQARKLLASVRPRDVAGKTRKRVAMELVVDLEKIYARTKAADKELSELVKATGTGLLELHGIGPPEPHGCWSRSATSPGSLTADTSRPGPAPHPSTHHRVTRFGTGSPGEATVRSTASCTSWPLSNCAIRPKDGPTSTGRRHRAKPQWKPCAA
jgi:transposase